MASNTKNFQSRPRPEKDGGSSSEPIASRTDQEITLNGHPTSDHQNCRHTLHTLHISYKVPSEEPPTSFTQPPSQSCSYHLDSTDVPRPPNHTSVLLQQSPGTECLSVTGSESAQRAHCPLNSKNHQKTEFKLPMTIKCYSPLGRWEAQTSKEDTWSTFVALESGARESIAEGRNMMRGVSTEDFPKHDRARTSSVGV